MEAVERGDASETDDVLTDRSAFRPSAFINALGYETIPCNAFFE